MPAALYLTEAYLKNPVFAHRTQGLKKRLPPPGYLRLERRRVRHGADLSRMVSVSDRFPACAGPARSGSRSRQASVQPRQDGACARSPSAARPARGGRRARSQLCDRGTAHRDPTWPAGRDVPCSRATGIAKGGRRRGGPDLPRDEPPPHTAQPFQRSHRGAGGETARRGGRARSRTLRWPQSAGRSGDLGCGCGGDRTLAAEEHRPDRLAKLGQRAISRVLKVLAREAAHNCLSLGCAES